MQNKSGHQQILLFVLFAFLLQGATAQTKTEKYQITGMAVDSATSKGVEYATAAVTNDSMKVIGMVAADGTGKFSLEIKQRGNFKLTLSALGYNPVSTALDIDGSNTKIDIGKIAMAGGIKIEEVTVAMQKPLVKSDVDKLTYSVEADPEAQTSTVAEILRKVPQLAVDAEDNVTLNGQSNYKVLVNGKSSKLFSSNFKDVIRSMPANSIKDIEVITNPSSKYEAEGVGGIINIITNKKSIGGYNGRVSLGAGSFGSYNGSAYMAAQVGKFNLSANYWGNRYGSPDGSSFSNGENYNSPTRRYSRSEGTNSGHGFSQMISVEASYEIDSLNLISLSFSGYNGNNKSNSESLSQYFDENHDLSMDFSSITRSKNTYGYLSGGIDYQKTFKKPDETFTVSYKMDNNPSRRDYLSEIDGRLNYDSYMRTSKNKAYGGEHTLQIDYYNPITKVHQIEAGVKYILRLNTSNSDASLYDQDLEIWEPDTKGLNDLDYTQHIFGAYGSYVFKLKKFSAKAGFRAEGTWNDGVSKIPGKDNTNFTNNIFNIVPNVSLSYQIKPTQTMRLSYTQRLQRPGIWYLNPYVNDVDPMNISYGNPELDAVVSHSVGLNYSLFTSSWNLFIGANSSFANNSITRITTVDDKGVSRSTYDNIGKDQNYGISGSFNYRLKTIFNIYCSVNAYYKILESPANDLKNEGMSVNGNLGMGVSLWKNARFNISGGIYSSGVNLQGRNSTSHYTSAGISQQLFKKKVDINLYVSNPFEGRMSYHYTEQDDTFYRYTESNYRTRRFNFNVGYRFGKMETQVKKAKRSISNDDKMSGGGGESSGGGK